MKTASHSPAGIIRTSRGLTIAGTRLTLYSVMDYLEAGWPVHLIQDWLNLTDPQIDAAMAYIEAHREEVEEEYRDVLRQARENREYWERRKPHHYASSIAEPRPEREEIRARLRIWKDRLKIA